MRSLLGSPCNSDVRDSDLFGVAVAGGGSPLLRGRSARSARRGVSGRSKRKASSLCLSPAKGIAKREGGQGSDPGTWVTVALARWDELSPLGFSPAPDGPHAVDYVLHGERGQNDAEQPREHHVASDAENVRDS